ncbi:protein phosphatase 2C domain-containing protein [Plantactinospora sp. B24E8]|uniref:PP2C family protein-serine/threonine phosphatase n=1 Tax=Plantactinospora sp. B24E8 TaxID=3153567 RepID=UPI00325ED9B0
MTAPGAGTAGSVPKPCPEHGPPDAPEHRFCEECGRELDRVPVTEVGTAATAWSGVPAGDGGAGTPTTAGTGSGSFGSSGPVGRAGSADQTTGWSRPSAPVTARWPQAERQAGPAGPGGPSGPVPAAAGVAAGVPTGQGGSGALPDPVVPGDLEALAGPSRALGAVPDPVVPGGLDALAGPSRPVGRSTPVTSATPVRPAAGYPAAPASVGHPPSSGYPAPVGPATPWLSSRAAGQPCPGCGAVPSGNPGVCPRCGHRWNVGRDRSDLDLGTVAAVTDRARRRRNEDAIAVGRLGSATVAVVCDGVSTSLRADIAAHAAAEGGLTAMLSALAGGLGAAETMVAGGRAAAAAARATAAVDDGQVPPSCTYVAAVVTVDSVTVGWIGDSRAYWLGPDGAVEDAVCLTIDDSVVAQIQAGRPVPPGAEQDPTSRALIRWLGADSRDADPQVVTFQPSRQGRLVLCSDGLSHYLSDPKALAVRVPGPGGGAPIAVARDLTRFAVESGGHDNVAVAVLPFPPTARPDGPNT